MHLVAPASSEKFGFFKDEFCLETWPTGSDSIEIIRFSVQNFKFRNQTDQKSLIRALSVVRAARTAYSHLQCKLQCNASCTVLVGVYLHKTKAFF